jgi:hypothetical protein
MTTLVREAAVRVRTFDLLGLVSLGVNDLLLERLAGELHLFAQRLLVLELLSDLIDLRVPLVQGLL